MAAPERLAQLRRLCALLAPDAPEVSQDEFVQHHGDLVQLADAFFVLPAFYLALKRRALLEALPQDLAEALHGVWVLNRGRNADLLAQARSLTEVLAEIDLRPVFIKGIAQILGGAHPVGARMTADLDVLVPPERLREAMLHLQSHGFASDYETETPITWMRSYAHHATPVIRPKDTVWVEMHRGLFSDPDYLMPTADMLAQARPVAMDGWQAWIPCPEHQVTTAIAHASLRGTALLGGGANLRDGLDCIALSRQGAVDFAAVAAQFREAGCHGAYAAYSALMADLFGAQAITGQPQDWSAITRARARALAQLWTRPRLQRMVNPGGALTSARRLLIDRYYREHFLRLGFDGTYRRNWRGRQH